ncbi:MAG: nucleotidyltransferase domain-containing protein [Candidatus Brockarchaeota archaeon]|nr:nucleotidyltransferase domain-containing protein [Candidatus Brockarchaeota archaeon]
MGEVLAGRPPVSAFALFGSRARGDNFDESDYDILVADARNLSSVFLERIELEGESVDLVHVPLSWLAKQIPYELDQMIYESIILADRDGILTSAQKWIRKYNYEPARISGRVGEILLKSDVLLSRASSALSRLDYESCVMHSKLAEIESSRALLEMSRIPYQPSRLAELLKSAPCKTGIDRVIPPADKAENARKCLEDILQTVAGSAKKRQRPPPESAEHAWVAAYFASDDFLRRNAKLVDNLMAQNRLQDVVLYSQINSYKVLEAYQVIKKLEAMADFVTVIRQIRGKTDPESARLYGAARSLYDIRDPTKQEAAEALQQARAYSNQLKRLRTFGDLEPRGRKA